LGQSKVLGRLLPSSWASPFLTPTEQAEVTATLATAGFAAQDFAVHSQGR
jgi:hypothetical protein